MEVIGDLLNSFPGYNIDTHIEHWKNFDVLSNQATYLTAPVAEARFILFMKEFWHRNDIDGKLATVFAIFKNDR